MEEILSPSSNDDVNSFPGVNLLSIPGIGKKTLAAMLSAVGFEGRAFDSGIKLIGHIGFFPKIYESGETCGLTESPEADQNISAGHSIWLL